MNDLIRKKITELDMSDSLKEVFHNNGFGQLGQLLDKSPEQLMEIPGLTLKHISEYKRFIIENDLQSKQKDF